MELAQDYPEQREDWYKKSNSIICLAVPNEQQLWHLSEKLTKKGLKHSKFYEPDCGEELTAIAVVPTDATRKALSNYPLVGRKPTPEGAQELLNKKFDIVDGMRSCYQHGTQNMLDHGNSVKDHLFDLLNHLETNEPLKNQWCLPTWMYEYKTELLANIHDKFTLHKYAVWHDCGKHLCKQIDEQGKCHYPCHAEMSKETFLTVYPELPVVAELIGRDMEIHTMKSSDVEAFCEGNKSNAVTLLLTGLAEVHANAKLFGGHDSETFKIKYKQIEKKGKLVCRQLFGIR